MFEPRKCDDCGGRGSDPGALYEEEVCQECMGSGRVLVEMDTRSSHYAKRKPMGRALPLPMTAGELIERDYLIRGGL